MAPAHEMFLLYLHDGTDSHREAVQQIVKTHAAHWAHHLPDVWIVAGHDHKYWANLIHPVLALSNAGLVVLELPRAKDERMFALRGNNPNRMIDWLWETYYGEPRPAGQLSKKD